MFEAPSIRKSDTDVEASKQLLAAIEFSQTDERMRVETVKNVGRSPEDLLLGNPDHKPFAIVLPVRKALPGTTLAAPEVEHCVFFTRLKSGVNVGFVAAKYWQDHVRTPDFPGSEYPSIEGELVVVALDDNDFMGYWKEAASHFKQNADKWPLVAWGHSRCPFAFCSPNIGYDLMSLGSDSTSGILSVDRVARNNTIIPHA